MSETNPVTLTGADLSAIKTLISCGIPNKEQFRDEAEKMKKKILLDKHPYEYYQGKNGNWYVYLPDPIKGRIKKQRSTEAAIKEVIIDYQEKLSQISPTVEELFISWNRDRLNHHHVLGPTFLRDQRFFDAYYGKSNLRIKRIDTVSREEFTAFLQERLSGLTAKQWGGLRGITRGILNFAEDNHYITYTADDVLSHVRIYKKSFKRSRKNPEEEVYFPEELEALRIYCISHPDPYTDCILLICYTGLRIGEAVTLYPSDIDLEKMLISVRRTETHADEEGNEKTCIHDLHRHLFEWLFEWVRLRSKNKARKTL